MNQQVNIFQLFSLFAFDIQSFAGNRRIASQEDADQLATDIKTEIKKRFHNLALQHHPDKGGDAEKFKELSNAYKFIQEQFRILIRPPQPQVIIVNFNMNMYNNYGGGATTATYSTTTSSMW